MVELLDAIATQETLVRLGLLTSLRATDIVKNLQLYNSIVAYSIPLRTLRLVYMILALLKALI